MPDACADLSLPGCRGGAPDLTPQDHRSDYQYPHRKHGDSWDGLCHQPWQNRPAPAEQPCPRRGVLLAQWWDDRPFFTGVPERKRLA